MHARHIVPGRMRRLDLGDDLVQVHRHGVHDARAGGRRGDDLRRHQRSGIKAHGAALDEPQAAHGDQVGRARSRADEMNGHCAAFPRAALPA